MKTLFRKWWDTPWTNGSYVKLCVKCLICTLAIWAVTIAWLMGWFDKTKEFIGRFRKKNKYYGTGGRQ